MPIYKWEGKTAKGVIKKGETEGPNEAAIRIHLRQQNIIPTKIASKGKEIKLSLPQKVKQRCFAWWAREAIERCMLWVTAPRDGVDGTPPPTLPADPAAVLEVLERHFQQHHDVLSFHLRFQEKLCPTI
jgi:hypothetical protein